MLIRDIQNTLYSEIYFHSPVETEEDENNVSYLMDLIDDERYRGVKFDNS